MKLVPLDSKFDGNRFSYLKCHNYGDHENTLVALPVMDGELEYLQTIFASIVLGEITLPGYRLYTVE